MSEQHRGISRRELLEKLGLATGMAVAAPMIPGFINKAFAQNTPVAKTGVRKLRVGMLQGSKSSIHLGAELFAQLHQERFDLIAGSEKLSILSQARKLVEQDKVEVILAHITPRMRTVRNYLEKQNVAVLQINAGEIMHRETAANIFHNTLQYSQSNFALGVWAAKHVGKTCAIAATCYES